MNTEETQKDIDEKFLELPQEVQDFLVGDEFAAVVEEINSFFADKTKLETLKTLLVLFFIDEKENAEMLKTFVDSLCHGDIEVKQKMYQLVQEKIIAPMQLLLEVHQELAEEAKVQAIADTPIKTAPSDISFPDVTPLEIAAPVATPVFSLASKMAMPGVVAPIASVGQKFVPGPQAPIAPSAPRPAVDPYREMPL